MFLSLYLRSTLLYLSREQLPNQQRYQSLFLIAVLFSPIISIQQLRDQKNSYTLYFFHLLTQNNSHQYELNYDVSPVLDGKINIAMTPLFDKNKVDPFKDGAFQQLQSFSLDPYMIDHKSKKGKKIRPRLPSSWYIIQNQLQGIIEENDEQHFDQGCSDCSQQASEQSQFNQDDNEQNSQQQVVQGEAEKQSNSICEQTNYQFKSPEWQAANPKKQLISKIKSVAVSQQLKNEDKITSIIEIFNKYLCEYQKFYFEELIENLKKQYTSATDLISVLIKGIDQTFKRQIKGLSFQKRRLKLLRYLDKKKRRIWRKKVSYDCRKKVADGRLRIKGKFVTHQQACQQLGLASVEGYTPEQLKEMLYRKLEQS